MKILTTFSRFLLTVIFTVYGLNGFLHFIPTPPPSGVAGQFMGALFVSKYLLVVSALQAGIVEARVETRTAPVRRHSRIISPA